MKPEYLKEISQILTQAKNANNPALDTLRPITTYLLQTLTDFQKAKTNLKSFNNGKYSFILNNEVEANHEVRHITSLSKTNIIDTNNNVFPIQNILNDPRFKLFVIDVWAHWCIPCIKEFPFLKKYENEYKDKPIKFITLSIDKEIDAKQWKQMLQRLTVKDNSYHFLLQNAENSPFRFFFNINNIPRYIVIDNEGKILNENFITPSNKDFKMNLDSYLIK